MWGKRWHSPPGMVVPELFGGIRSVEEVWIKLLQGEGRDGVRREGREGYPDMRAWTRDAPKSGVWVRGKKEQRVELSPLFDSYPQIWGSYPHPLG